MRLLTLSKPSGQANGGSYSRYWAQHLSQHVVNTCFPVSTLAVLTPIFVSQQLPLKADLCTNVHPQALAPARWPDVGATHFKTTAQI